MSGRFVPDTQDALSRGTGRTTPPYKGVSVRLSGVHPPGSQPISTCVVPLQSKHVGRGRRATVNLGLFEECGDARVPDGWAAHGAGRGACRRRGMAGTRPAALTAPAVDFLILKSNQPRGVRDRLDLECAARRSHDINNPQISVTPKRH